ncbi:hypothetical protein PsorP6_004367 [Peronosclerospora sorghi]|uniref:Uncharacterized protein n=1 Tax=Peronosclerospora sorghi TaxID=230839 RepID=A0ACC0VSA3_9STRA|nr:hypothetical protein PsorP6_004367 [Peronosclerospora sorghi]
MSEKSPCEEKLPLKLRNWRSKTPESLRGKQISHENKSRCSTHDLNPISEVTGKWVTSAICALDSELSPPLFLSAFDNFSPKVPMN